MSLFRTLLGSLIAKLAGDEKIAKMVSSRIKHEFHKDREGLSRMKEMKSITESDDALVIKMNRLMNRDMVDVYEYVLAENRVYKRICQKKGRIQLTEDERRTLVRYGMPIKHRLKEVMTIVQPETLLTWHRRMKRKKWDYSRRQPKHGRPRIADDTEALIVKLAKENIWGYSRITGELKKLGFFVCPTTVKNVLRKHGLPPAPDRKGMSWKQFITAHFDSIWAADFFTEEVWTLFGLVTFYVLFFIHLGSRRVSIVGYTTHPNAQWTAQQARNFIMHLDEISENCRYLIHDRDQSFLPFDHVIKSEDIKIVRTPPQSPLCNPYAERFVLECRETLNNMIPLGERHFFRILKTIEKHHNFERPHQGIGNVVPLDTEYPDKPAQLDTIRCKASLGGLLNHYFVDNKAA